MIQDKTATGNSTLSREKILLFSSPQHPDWLWSLFSILNNENGGPLSVECLNAQYARP
jgi:hypothetical protein